MATQYVIRKQSFWYNDEWYSPIKELAGSGEEGLLGGIYEIFTEHDAAHKKFRTLILEELRQEGYCNQFNPDFMYELEVFIRKTIQNDTFKLGDTLPLELSDDHLFEFAQTENWMPYVLQAFGFEKKLYVVWSFQDKQYLIDHYNDTALVAYDDGVALGGASQSIFSALSSNRPEPIRYLIIGHHETPSEHPELLNHLLRIPNTGIAFNTSAACIEFSGAVSDVHFHTFNSLLKKPFYELHPIRPDQIKQVFENPTVKIA